MGNVDLLQKSLSVLQPIHDTPFGRLHPYWARKPLNVVTEIIRNLSKENDIVCDPFMGCGTTVFASLQEKRSIFGSDINPLSSLIVNGTLILRENPQKSIDIITEFVNTVTEFIIPWFMYGDKGQIIERERYSVDGEFENGKYSLIPEELILKKWNKTNFSQRSVIKTSEFRHPSVESLKPYLFSPMDFRKYKLTANSRIAIPEGALLSHYFSDRNTASINYALSQINTSLYTDKYKLLLKFFLSSTLPLLRLSDYKASSQWPYWRPKTRLTSRNPIFIFRRRLNEFQKARTWLEENLPEFEIGNLEDHRTGALCASIHTTPVQSLAPAYLEGASVDLVLSDPPYGDHVPYLEYSSLWISSLGLSINQSDFGDEIVISDAKERTTHTARYLDNLLLGLKKCSEILKPKGYLVWFYQDSDIKNWAALYNTSIEIGLDFITLIPLPKQRRSAKTVFSPGRTFDGDLVLIFQKRESKGLANITYPNLPPDKIKKEIEKIINTDEPFFYRYANLIRNSLLGGWINSLSEIHKDIRELM